MAIQTDVYEMLGTYICPATTPVATADILAYEHNGIPIFSTATIAKIKTDGVMLSINGTAKFPATFDSISHLATGKTFNFNKETTLLIGKYVTV